MGANLTRRQVGDVFVVDVVGTVTLGEGATTLREEIRALATAGARKVVLNLADISYIDSAGLGELVSGVTTISHAGGALRLLKAGSRIQELLKMTRLDSVFLTFEDEGAAMRSFS